MKKSLVFLALFLLPIGASFSQEQYGNIRGVVTDAGGEPIPGAALALESALLSPRSALSSAGGVFRFINITPGIYRLKCELQGFKTFIQENIDIRIGTNYDLNIKMEPVSLQEEITIEAESPIVDTKKTGTVMNATQEMLQDLPSARDPWVILQQVPGILVDRENIGGSTSGQQSYFIARGGMSWNTIWNMDGIPIHDMAATGSSNVYYDFDTFEEIQIVTGGADATVQTGSVSINFVTRRGENKFRAAARTFFTNDDLQGDNRTKELKGLNYVGNRINQLMDYGLQLGGPLKKDNIWYWLGYGVQDIRLLTISGYPDNAKIQNVNSKLNFQLSRKNRAELAFIKFDKLADGSGASPTRPPETTRNVNSSSYFIKFEDEHFFSSNFLLSLKLSYYSGVLEVTPQGGMENQAGYDLDTGIWSGSYEEENAERLSYVAKLDGNYFLEKFAGGNHELKFGVEYRLFPMKDNYEWPGGAVRYFSGGAPLFAEVTRQGSVDFISDHVGFYLNDAYTVGRLTLNLGLRLDREDATNRDASVQAGKVAPDLLPAVTYPGVDPGVTFWTFSPRMGFTYDFAGNGKTILRGNIARYGSQMGIWVAGFVSSSSNAGAGFIWDDLNGDNKVSMDELPGYPKQGILWYWGFDPSNPTNFESLNGVDKNLKVELSDEILVGVERELFANFSLSADLILRRNHRFMPFDINQSAYYDKETGTVITRDDYVGPIAGSVSYGGKTYDRNRIYPVGLPRGTFGWVSKGAQQPFGQGRG